MGKGRHQAPGVFFLDFIVVEQFDVFVFFLLVLFMCLFGRFGPTSVLGTCKRGFRNPFQWKLPVGFNYVVFLFLSCGAKWISQPSTDHAKGSHA